MRGGKPAGERLKTARKRSASSARWLSRQLADPYVKQAKAAGWRSRAAFKLIELDEKFVDVIVRRYISEYGDAGVFILRGDEKIPYAEVADDGTD